MSRSDAKDLKRFHASYEVRSNGCWIWVKSITRNRDGRPRARLYTKGKKTSAYRWAYEKLVGPIPEGLDVCHHCDDPLCVNPEHLFVGTQLDNMRDMINKGRQKITVGEDNGCAKLTEDAVRFIRKMYRRGHPLYGWKGLAKKYGVVPHTIQKVLNGKLWKHVKDQP